MYEDVFAINEDSRKKDYKTYPLINEYYLNNYSFLKPKLDSEFYYTYFLRTCLFDIDVMELSDFFQFQLENCNNSEKLIELVKLRILPDIDKIISNAKITGIALEYRGEKKIKASFVETEGRIINRDHDFQVFYSLTASKQLKEGHNQRKKIIKKVLKKCVNQNDLENSNKLKWIGKPMHLALLMRYMADLGYIEIPIKPNRDPNAAEFARLIINSFNIEKDCTLSSLTKYGNPDDEKNKTLYESFKEKGLNIPDADEFH